MIRHLSIVRTCLVLGLVLGLSASPLEARADENRPLRILSVDDSAFPKIRFYLEVPTKEWADGEVKLEFRQRGEKYDAIVKAIEKANDKAGDSEGEEGESEESAEGVPQMPTHEGKANGIPFVNQDDPKQDLLVTFLLDNSESMTRKPERDKSKRHQLAIDMVDQIIKRKVRDRDTVVLAQFAGEVEKIYGPSAASEGALKALNSKYVRANKKADMTNIFHSVDITLERWLSKRKVSRPTLPHRRILVVISDGNNTTTTGLNPEQVAGKFKELTRHGKEEDEYGILVAVGIGAPPKARKKRYNDLRQLASLVNGNDHLSEEGTTEDALKTFDLATTNLHRQVMVDLEVPKYHWQKGEHEVAISVTGPTKEGDEAAPTKSLSYTLKLASLSDAQKDEGKAYQTELQDFVTSTEQKEKEEESEEEKKDAWKLYGIIGGSVLIFLILFILIASKKRQARERTRLAREEAIRAEEEMKREEDNRKILARMEEQERKAQEQAEENRRAAEEAAQAAAEAARTVLATLTGADGPLKGRVFPIKDPRCLIGRDDEHCQLAFPNDDGDLSISRVHAQLIFQAGGWSVVCMSNGGMAVNQTSLRKDEQYPVQFGDLLTMGKSVFRFGAA